ncbi:MAG TPA: hypothetical protein VIK28_08535, partial [Sedimentisphaerales bacterium]
TNPPSGAVIDYYLRTKPQTPISLEILNEAGNPVRRFSSADLPEPLAGAQYFMNEWLPKIKPLSAELGHHRFMWDLRYTPPPVKQRDYSMAAIAGQGTEKQPQGPLVLPRKYQIKLSVGDNTYTQSLEVELDPRVHVPESALKDQLSLAIDVWNAMADQISLGEEADSLRGQLASVEHKPELDSITRSMIISLKTEIAGFIDSMSNGGFSGLETTIMSADREPTQQMWEAFGVLNEKFSASKKKLQELIAGELIQLNRNLEMLGISKLSVATPSVQHLTE